MRKPKNQSLVPVAAPPPQSITAPIGFDTLVAAFFRGKDPETVRAYEQRMANFASFLGVGTSKEAAELFLSQGQGKANLIALNFQDHLLREKKYSPNYVAGHLTALNSIVKLGQTLGIVPWSIRINRVTPESYRDTRGPGTAAIDRVLVTLGKKDDPASVRDRAIITILYECCARRGDLLSLDLEHVDFNNHRLWPRRKKRSERTELEIHGEAEKVLREWIEVRGDHPGPLFTNFDRSGKGDTRRLTGMSIGRICHKYGLGKPHGLRHTGATDALTVTNGNIPEVMKRTGHKDPKTLMIYNDNRLRTAASTSQKISDYRKSQRQ